MSKAKRLLTPREAAEALGITVPELAALRRSGEAPERYRDYGAALPIRSR